MSVSKWPWRYASGLYTKETLHALSIFSFLGDMANLSNIKEPSTYLDYLAQFDKIDSVQELREKG